MDVRRRLPLERRPLARRALRLLLPGLLIPGPLLAGLTACGDTPGARPVGVAGTSSPAPAALPTPTPDPETAAAKSVFLEFATAYFEFAREGYRSKALPAKLIETTVDDERQRLTDELTALRSTGMHVASGESRVVWLRAIGARTAPLDPAIALRACVDNTRLKFASPAPSSPPRFVTYDAIVRRDSDLRWKVAHIDFTWSASC